jgi:hypothetical protein
MLAAVDLDIEQHILERHVGIGLPTRSANLDVGPPEGDPASRSPTTTLVAFDNWTVSADPSTGSATSGPPARLPGPRP